MKRGANLIAPALAKTSEHVHPLRRRASESPAPVGWIFRALGKSDSNELVDQMAGVWETHAEDLGNTPNRAPLFIDQRDKCLELGHGQVKLGHPTKLSMQGTQNSPLVREDVFDKLFGSLIHSGSIRGAKYIIYFESINMFLLMRLFMRIACITRPAVL